MSATPTRTSHSFTNEGNATPAPPYPPSWINRLAAWIERLPFPPIVFYGGLWLTLFAVQTGIKWWEGAYPVGTVYPFHIYLTALGPYSLALIHFMLKSAGQALAQFRPALVANDAEYTRLHYELTTLPARATLGASALNMLWPLLVFPLWSSQPDYKLATSSVSLVYDFVLVVVTSWIVGAAVYGSIRLVRWISHIYTDHTRINLFQIGPLYIFSSFTARLAFLSALVYSVWLMTTPGRGISSAEMVLALPVTLVVVMIFVWPLLGVHNLLSAEKRRLQGEVGGRLESVLANLHKRADNGDLSTVDSLNKLLVSLTMERDILARIPTWPWETETIRLLITALVLPLVLFLTQRVLSGAFF